MADAPEPPSRRPSTASNASHLRYPTLPPLSGSVEEWLSRSRPISMTSTPSSDNPSKSLSESWATLSVSDIHSEDGARSEQTDVGSLIDPSGPEDVASLDDRYSSSEIDGNDEERFDGDDYDSKSNVSESQELPAIFPQIGGSIEDSNLTAKTAFRSPTESIEFIEPDNWPEVERVELKHTIRVFEGDEAVELQDQLPFYLQGSILTATIQQTMTKKSLDTDKPFRVLYIGSSEFRNIILDKIGDVLVSSNDSGFESNSTESSRYHVVPTSYGAGAVPNFAELLPIHVQLIVDECSAATSQPQADKPSTIDLDFKNRSSCTSLWTGEEFSISSSSEWTLPDVAIIFLSNADTATVMETQRLARIVMERHYVPTMIISEKPLWKMTRELIPLNHYSLHMCLESRHQLTGKTTVLRRYPIDLNTFESITPGQLNRNLASLSSIYPNRSNKVTAENSRPTHKKPRFSILEYARSVPYLKDDHYLAFVLRTILVSVICAVTITLGQLASQFLARSAMDSLGSGLSSTNSTSSIMSANKLSQNSLSVLPSPAGEVQMLGKQPPARSQLDDLLGALSSPEQEHKSSEFEIQVVGDCHLVIKPPSKASTGKKQPKFSVQVSRRDKPLAYELSKLFEGVYTLKLDRGDAYGIVNVSITTISKQPIHQTTSVDFGTPWLKIANWKRAAQVITSQLLRDISTAQTGFSEVYGRLCTDLQVIMGDVVKRAHVLRREAEDIRRDSMQLSLGTREEVISRSRQLSEVVRRTAVQPFLAASSVLHDHTHKVNREAKEIMSDTWSRISIQAQGLDLGTVMDHVRNVRKCNTLDKAQKRARGMVGRDKCRHSECSR